MSRLSVFYILFFISSCSINEEWSLMSCIVTNNVPYWLFFIQQQDPDYWLFISATELILSYQQWSRLLDFFLVIFSRKSDSPAVQGVSLAARIRWGFLNWMINQLVRYFHYCWCYMAHSLDSRYPGWVWWT